MEIVTEETEKPVEPKDPVEEREEAPETSKIDKQDESTEDDVIEEATEAVELLETDTDSEKTILILGGENSQKGLFDEMFMLNEDRSKWLELPIKLPHPMAGGGAVYLDGEIYIVGGYYEYKQLHVWDKEKKEWKRLTDMNEARTDIASSCLGWNGSIWVLGGYTGKEYLKSVERYDPKEEKWIQMPDMSCPRRQSAAAVYNGKIVVCGGMDPVRCNSLRPLKSAESLDPESGIWSEFDDMPVALRGHCILSFLNILAVIGGHNGDSCVTSILVWTDEKWSVLPITMSHPSRLFTVAILDNSLYFMGGWNRSGRQDLDRVEVLEDGKVHPGPDLPYECSQLASVVIPRDFFD